LLMRNFFIYFIILGSFIFHLSGCAAKQVSRGRVIYKDLLSEKKVSRLKENIRLNTDDKSSYIELAKIYLKEDMVDRAIETLTQALGLDRGDVPTMLLLSLALQRKDKPDLKKALECLEQAREIEPENSDVFLNLGHLYAKRGQDQEAVVAFQKAIGLSGDQVGLVSARLALMAFYKKTGQKEKADEQYAQVKKIYPGIDDMMKQFEIRELTPAPQYGGDAFIEGDGIHPPMKERMRPQQEQIKEMDK